MNSRHAEEVALGDRFAFGDNWRRFLTVLNEDRIQRAMYSLQEMLEEKSLEGKTFLDVGCGSGLFSLAARRLGARVHSFDYDPQSVECAKELKERYVPDDPNWYVGVGSVLDQEYIKSLGEVDIVYSWGVLHHTGAMWQALENVSPIVTRGGKIFIAIYNDQGIWSRCWWVIKYLYNKLPKVPRMLFAFFVLGLNEMKMLLISCLKGKPVSYFYKRYNYAEQSTRGMSYWYDLIDWIGGYPFEVAKPDEIFNFYRTRGFELRQLRTWGCGAGCNEFIFEKK